ncbi:Uncharacterised protein [Mycobacteroides abscessus subsp. abscessus]|nr:Uncharacterised protein [Mycobacteroides abscessus subsp. abscessus]
MGLPSAASWRLVIRSLPFLRTWSTVGSQV